MDNGAQHNKSLSALKVGFHAVALPAEALQLPSLICEIRQQSL